MRPHVGSRYLGGNRCWDGAENGPPGGGPKAMPGAGGSTGRGVSGCAEYRPKVALWKQLC